MSWGKAKEAVRLAEALEQMPVSREALSDGSLSLLASRVLAEAQESEPEAFSGSEPDLVQAATSCSVSDLRKAVAIWCDAAACERGLDREERLRRRRGFYASRSFSGMVRTGGQLDPDNGEPLLVALRAQMDAEAKSGEPDDRTPAQRRADALGEICRQWLDLASRPTVAGERPHLVVTVPVEALTTDASAELEHAGPVPTSLARRLACDATVRRVVLGPGFEPLDVGRRTHVVPPSLRRALVVRDRGCRFPGCDRPPPWTDAHHAVHWADGGPTSLENLVLLCRSHHRLIHRRGGFGLEMLEGRPVFRRPDGSVLEEARPPP